ncbi:MAG: alpha/beta hydrolase [Lachnospiraceae bacterium]
MIQKEEFYYDSGDGIHKIYAVKWIPETEDILGVVQIVHGMAEHIERYETFADYLAKRGIAVVGNDHLGHGKSVNNKEEYGYFCKKDAVTIVVRDIYRLKKLIQEENPGKPYYILGHSMGSLLLRNYLFKYGTDIDGVILSGTASHSPLKIISGKALLQLIALFKGLNYHSKLADMLVNGNSNERIENKRTRFDWLSTDEEIVDTYVKDEACGFLFTVNGFLTLLQSVDNLNKKKYLANMPKSLPVLFLSGEQDPVGGYTAGVKRAYRQFEKAGMKCLSLKFYADCRHEILNEKNKKEVYEDIYAFLMIHNEKKTK